MAVLRFDLGINGCQSGAAAWTMRTAMTTVIAATFDGQVLRPEEPLALPANTRVRLTLETDEPVRAVGSSFLATAESLRLDGPSDWSSRLEHYLYGEPSDKNG